MLMDESKLHAIFRNLHGIQEGPYRINDTMNSLVDNILDYLVYDKESFMWEVVSDVAFEITEEKAGEFENLKDLISYVKPIAKTSLEKYMSEEKYWEIPKETFMEFILESDILATQLRYALHDTYIRGRRKRTV